MRSSEIDDYIANAQLRLSENAKALNSLPLLLTLVLTHRAQAKACKPRSSLFRAEPRGFAIVLAHPFTNLAQTLPVEVNPSHGPLSKRLTATSSPRRETIRSSYCYSSLAVIGAATQHVALCISLRLHLAQGIP